MGRKKYEYQVLQANSLVSAEQLNKKSEEGWRLIEIVLIEFTYFFYFEREA